MRKVNTNAGKKSKKVEKFGIMTLKEAIDMAKFDEKIVINWCNDKIKGASKTFCGWCTFTANRSLITDGRTAAVIFRNKCMHR
uniref:Uncharacterized protein n=1 Tax=Ciona savignyi TaxID=51511 RepID=H2YXW4_CIOSA